MSGESGESEGAGMSEESEGPGWSGMFRESGEFGESEGGCLGRGGYGSLGNGEV